MKYYADAYDVFYQLQDELFMLLTCKLIVETCRSNKYNNKFSKEFEDILSSLLKQPTFRDVRVDLLFENFERRIELAKVITRDLQNIEGTFRDDQFKQNNNKELQGVEKVNDENNKIWKQAVRLALRKSLVTAKLVEKNDKEISHQKKEQLITVASSFIVEHGPN